MFRLFHSYNSVGGPVKVNNMLSTLNIPIGEKKMHWEASQWKSWKGCRNVSSKYKIGSVWDGNAVRIELFTCITINLLPNWNVFAICVLTLENNLQRHFKGRVGGSFKQYECCWWRPGCVSSFWCLTVYQLYWIILTQITFLFFKNNIQFQIFIH